MNRFTIANTHLKRGESLRTSSKPMNGSTILADGRGFELTQSTVSFRSRRPDAFSNGSNRFFFCLWSSQSLSCRWVRLCRPRIENNRWCSNGAQIKDCYLFRLSRYANGVIRAATAAVTSDVYITRGNSGKLSFHWDCLVWGDDKITCLSTPLMTKYLSSPHYTPPVDRQTHRHTNGPWINIPNGEVLQSTLWHCVNINTSSRVVSISNSCELINDNWRQRYTTRRRIRKNTQKPLEQQQWSEMNS